MWYFDSGMKGLSWETFVDSKLNRLHPLSMMGILLAKDIHALAAIRWIFLQDLTGVLRLT